MQVLQTSFRDTRENDIKISVWPLPKLVNDKSEFAFDYSFFYDPMEVAAPLRDDTMGNDDDKVRYDDLLLRNMLLGWKKIRRALALPLLLPDWKKSSRPGLALDIYNLVQEAQVPNLIPIHQVSGRYV